MATFSTNAGLGIPSLTDTDFPTTITNTLNLLDSFETIGAFRVKLKQNPSTSLVVSHSGGTCVKNNGTELTVAGSDLTMTANQTNYIYVDSSGVVQQNTTGFPAASILAIAVVVAGASSITSISHVKRPFRQSGANLSSELLALAGGTMTGLLILSGTGASAGLQFTTTAAPGSPADGQLWYDSTFKCILGSLGGATARFPSTQFFSTASATVASTAAETSIIGAGTGSLTLVANQIASAKIVRIRGWGILSNTGSPTATFNFKVGSYSITTGAVATGTGVTNVGVAFEAIFTVRSSGAGGVIIGQATVTVNGVTFHAVATATGTLDTTGTAAVAATLTWSASSASNTATFTNTLVEIHH